MLATGRFKVFGRRVAADTLALALFSITVGLITTFVIERYILGFSLVQWGIIRLVYNPLRFGAARLLGKLTDRMRMRIGGSTPSRLRKAVADSTTLALYQPFVYMVSALLVGANFKQISIAIPIYIVESFVTGWLYGIILDYVRQRFQKKN